MPTSTAPDELTARQQQGARSRTRILDTAEALIAERGFAGTSISQIAKGSGLPASSIYWHFSSKGDLLSAVVERSARRWLRARPAWEEYDGDLPAFLRAVGTATADRPAFLRLFILLVLEDHESSPEVARDLVQQVWHRVRENMAQVLTEAFDFGTSAAARRRADRLARFFMATVDGVYVDAHIDPDGTDVAAVFDDLHTALSALTRQPTGGHP